MKSWTESIIQQWKTDSIPLNKGALIEMILETENALGFKFPGDFMELYLQVDGFADMEIRGSIYAIWPIHKILGVYRENGNKQFIGFSDSLANGHTIGFLKNKTGVFKAADLQHPVAMSFKEGLLLINQDSRLLY